MRQWQRKKREKPRYTGESLQELALRYVGRYATSRGKLRSYLNRKVRERGFEGDGDAAIDALISKFHERGYVDDAGYASMKARDLAARGYGERRLGSTLYAAGINEADGEEARQIGADNRVAAALAYARRRRFGPFANEQVEDRKLFEKQLAAMLRAGHPPALSRKILQLKPGDEPDIEALKFD